MHGINNILQSIAKGKNTAKKNGTHIINGFESTLNVCYSKLFNYFLLAKLLLLKFDLTDSTEYIDLVCEVRRSPGV